MAQLSIDFDFFAAVGFDLAGFLGAIFVEIGLGVAGFFATLRGCAFLAGADFASDGSFFPTTFTAFFAALTTAPAAELIESVMVLAAVGFVFVF